MKAPFPWFGGKSRAADLIWSRFGDVVNYVEPFAGSLAVLLRRPGRNFGTETVNDLDCYVANFWRALKCDPATVADHADWPVNEADLHARHLWLVGRAEFRERMMADPDYYDPKIAGWWVWGVSAWIGSGWCSEKYWFDGDAGMGVHRPSQQIPHVGNASMGVRSYLLALSHRLRRVRVACGDWSRVLGDSVTVRHGVTGVLLDPPYGHDERQADLYAVDRDLAAAVRDWAAENGNREGLRVALCGYDGEHDGLLDLGWSFVAWKARGGYGSQGNGDGRENASRERIWFSPHCVKPQPGLFDLL